VIILQMSLQEGAQTAAEASKSPAKAKWEKGMLRSNLAIFLESERAEKKKKKRQEKERKRKKKEKEKEQKKASNKVQSETVV
jgi:hypothetical protein